MKKDKNTVLLALTTAAMILPGISKKADANPIDPATTFDYKFSVYEEGALPSNAFSDKSQKRYTIDANQFKFRTPILNDSEITLTGVQESMSGASPWYVIPELDDNGNLTGKSIQVMSGATIEEQRSEIGGAFRSYNKNNNAETTISAGYSSENDYRSLSFGFSGAFYLNQQLTTLEYGVNTSKDYIDATQPTRFTPTRPTNELKNRLGMFAGVSHVLTKNTLVGATISYALLDGYLSDPYKQSYVVNKLVRDSRPFWNEQIALTLMLRQFFPSVNGALHVDYRNFSSTWKVGSQTIDLAWYQNIGNDWQLIPSVRTYQQTKAEFYQLYYETTRVDGYYSNDYRLSDFSANSVQLKLQKTFETFKINVSYEKYNSTGDNPGLVSFDYYSLGLSKKF